MKKIILLVVFIIGLLLWFSAANKEHAENQSLQKTLNNSNFNLTKVAEGIYLHQGKHVSFDHEDHDDIANVGFIIGDDCVAVVDTSGSVKVAKHLKQSIESITETPICYVINTHVHFDHLLGNVIFKSENTKFIGHVNLLEAIESSREFFLTEFAADLGEYANDEGLVPPTVLVEDSLVLDLGNRELTLRAFQSAHSNSDLIVVDQQTQVAWLGDLLFVERIPALDGSLKGWLAVIDELETLNFKKVIPGHGPVVDWPQGIQAEKDYLNLLLTDIRHNLEQGAFMEDVVENVGSEEKLHWLLHEQHHKRNVTKAFSELEWE